MKVADLLDQLKDVPGDTVIVMSSDGEGNNFSPLSDCSSGVYVPQTTWMGEFYSTPSENDDSEDINYFEAMSSDPGATPAIVFWPVN